MPEPETILCDYCDKPMDIDNWNGFPVCSAECGMKLIDTFMQPLSDVRTHSRVA